MTAPTLHMFSFTRLSHAVACACICTFSLQADEGLWLFNEPPLGQLKERYGFEPDPGWLERLQRSSVRLPKGSGAFVSDSGLIVTNQHVVSQSVEAISTSDNNWTRDGFVAKSQADEIKLPGAFADILISSADVTRQVQAAIDESDVVGDQASRRRAAIAKIEKEFESQTGLRSTVVALYQGAVYHVYGYKRYTDLRLVFAPEHQAALFGGDPDNFEFPRFDLDVALVRAYENDKPAHTAYFLPVEPQGAKEGDLVFVTGHPGRTSRNLTLAELVFLRDVHLPFSLNYITLNETLFMAWSARSVENARLALDELMTVQNARKLHYGRFEALIDSEILERKRSEEQELTAFARSAPELRALEGAWNEISSAQALARGNYSELYVLESYLLNSKLCKFARWIHRAAEERAKNNSERLPEYREGALRQRELELLAEVPLHSAFERQKLEQYFLTALQHFGAEHDIIKILLAAKSPSDRATDLTTKTRLFSADYRKKLWSLSAAELASVQDPILDMIRKIDVRSRNARKAEDLRAERVRRAHVDIQKVRRQKYGQTRAPDATGTLRLSFGTVKGYESAGGPVPWFTTMGGLFARSSERANKEPFDVPVRWAQNRAKIPQETPYNFISDCDMIGGSSGSPLVNREGKLVGVVFDGNIESLAAEYHYTDERARCIAVDVRALLVSLRHIYDGQEVAAELNDAGD